MRELEPQVPTETTSRQMQVFDQGLRLLRTMMDLQEGRIISGQPTEVLDKTITRHAIAMSDFAVDLLKR